MTACHPSYPSGEPPAAPSTLPLESSSRWVVQCDVPKNNSKKMVRGQPFNKEMVELSGFWKMMRDVSSKVISVMFLTFAC